MVSPRLVGLKQRVSDLASIFIADKDDLDATNEDHLKAVAFRIMASAAIEQYVEERCKEVATEGIARLKKQLPTTTGRAMIVWGVSRKNPGCIPIDPDEISDHYDRYDEILKGYLDSVASNHGVNGRDIKNLINPVGVRSHQLPEELVDRLQALAKKRDPAVHTTVTKASGRIGPSVERKQIDDIIARLSDLDEALAEAVSGYPLPRGQGASLGLSTPTEGTTAS